MNRFDLCIILYDENSLYEGAFAIILDKDYEDFYHVEIWNFEKFDGAAIEYVNKMNLRLATKEEMQQYQIKFKEYCNRSQGYS